MIWLREKRQRFSRCWQAMLGLILLNALGCSSSGGSNSGTVKYYLSRAATATKSNILHLEVDNDFRPKFQLSGSGFSAEPGLDQLNEFRAETILNADEFGEVFVNVTLYQENDEPYIEDRLSWKSSPEIPPKPEAYFSENASSDSWVYLVLPKQRGRNVKEVWIEGDLHSELANGQYYTIQADDQVLVHLSDTDGVKTMRIKYRNIFGSESDTADLEIIRKSEGPKNCQVLPVSLATSSNTIRTRISAINDGPLFYKVTGDVDLERPYQRFENSIDELIALSPGEGQKALRFKIKDDAENFCDSIELTITYDRSYVPGRVSIKDDRIWTDSPDITILPEFDYLAGDIITMHVSGGVLASDKTFQWIPYAEQLNITLSPSQGTRHAIVQFRKNETLMAEVSVPIYLRPYVQINHNGAQISVSPSQIVGMQSLSLSGCVQTYQKVAYAASYPCTPTAAQAEIIYYLNDASTLTRSAAF